MDLVGLLVREPPAKSLGRFAHAVDGIGRHKVLNCLGVDSTDQLAIPVANEGDVEAFPTITLVLCSCVYGEGVLLVL